MIEKEIAKVMILRNSEDYNLRKAAEELIELGLVLLQQVNKPHEKLQQEIIDEIGDVKIRMEVLSIMFPADKIQERIEYKVEKFKKLLKRSSSINI
jgi:hypothetical protein